MRYIDFYNYFKSYPVIHLSDIRAIESDFDHRRLYEWQKSGHIKRVANNFYVFADRQLSESEMNFIANKLHEPSYLSMEYALGYYSLIPEAVFLRTSVTSRKTKNLSTEIGNFVYHKIKKELFFGYHLIEGPNKTTFKIAEPEKALIDFLYLRKDLRGADDFAELRINEDVYGKIIDAKKIRQYLKVFASPVLKRKMNILKKIINS